MIQTPGTGSSRTPMRHSFIYKRYRVEIDLRPRDGGWLWAYNLNHAPQWSADAFSAGRLQDALRTSCDSARAAVDEQPPTKNESHG